MFKYLLVFSITLSLNVFAQDKNSECLCLKVDKSLAKELKALIIKHGGKIEVVSNTNIKKTINAQIALQKELTIKKDKQTKVNNDMQNAKNLYNETCKTCHGEKADVEAYGYSRALSTLSIDDMQVAIREYSLGEYDRGMAIIMAPEATRLSEDDVKGIYQYIQTLK